MASRDVRRAGVDVFAVYLVGEEIQVVLLHEVAYLVHLATCVQIARRVVGVADEDGTGVLVDKLLKLLHLRQRESLLNGSGYGANLGSCRDGKRHVVGIGWLRDDNLVARIETRHECEEHCLRSARRDDDVVGGDINLKSLVIFGEFLAIREVSCRWRILQNLAVDVLQGIKSYLRCGQVGLANIEVVDFNAALFGSSSQRSQFTDWRFGHFKSAY